jgi:hypothetical protein
VIDGDFEPIPATGAPPGWEGEREIVRRRIAVRRTAPQTCISTPSEVAARIDADKQLERDWRYSPGRFPERSGSTAIGRDSATISSVRTFCCASVRVATAARSRRSSGLGATGCVGSGGGDDDGVAVALEGLQGVATCAPADQLRLVPAGCDVDRELYPERV